MRPADMPTALLFIKEESTIRYYQKPITTNENLNKFLEIIVNLIKIIFTIINEMTIRTYFDQIQIIYLLNKRI